MGSCWALMSIPGIKGVEIGDGFACAGRRSQVHDELFYEAGKGYYRTTNARGIEEACLTARFSWYGPL